MSEPLKYLPPDYTGIMAESLHPTEDGSDGLEELMDEDEIAIERELDRLEYEETKKDSSMTNNIFVEGNKGRGPNFGVGSPGGNPNDPGPWEMEGSTNSYKNWKNASPNNGYYSSSSNVSSTTDNTTVKVEGTVPIKSFVVTNFLDCLYESSDSRGRPRIFPRGIYDLIPKLDIWSRIGSFGLTTLGILVSDKDLKRLVEDSTSSTVLLNYVSLCLSSYLRIPKENILFIRYTDETSPRADILMKVLDNLKIPQQNTIFIGICTGRWGLSNRDICSAREAGMDYIDVYNLRDGKYVLE